MKDIIVAQSLRKRGVGLNDMDEILRYEAIERMPRILDKPPKRLNFNKAKDIEVYGCCSELTMCYKELKEACTYEQCKLDLKGKTRYCDVDVFLILQALINQSICNSKERAEACMDVFKVIMLTPGDVLTTARVYETLKNYQPYNYYAGELVKGIHICLFNEKAPVLYWVSLCDFTGYYKEAIELGREVIRQNCETEKDVEKFLRPLYREAKADEEFMSKIYKPGANKWLIPMLYQLSKNNPDILNVTVKEDGFA